MNLITTDFGAYNMLTHVIFSDTHIGEDCDIIKMPCLGCNTEIVRIFTKHEILDCKMRSLSSIYDGVICASCLHFATYTPAEIIQNNINWYKNIPLTDFENKNIKQLTKLERIQAYLAKVAECQDWDIITSIQNDAINLRKEVATWN